MGAAMTAPGERVAGSGAASVAAQPAQATSPDVRDLLLAAAAPVLAALLMVLVPDGNVVRIALAGAVVFLAPGYLLLEATAPAGGAGERGREARPWRLAMALGLSPAVVALVALAAALVPGGFRPLPIAGAVALVCVALAAVALRRRRAAGSPAASPARRRVLTGG